jgi:hypothetical protein
MNNIVDDGSKPIPPNVGSSVKSKCVICKASNNTSKEYDNERDICYSCYLKGRHKQPPITNKNDYTLIVATNNGVFQHYVHGVGTDLLSLYKQAKLEGQQSVVWERGVIDMKAVIGIIDITQRPVNI